MINKSSLKTKRHNKFKKYLFIACGSLALALGILGVLIPILPTTPFLLVAAACYAKSSERFHQKLVNSELYKKYISQMVEQKGMTLKAKLTILIPVLCMLLVVFLVVDNIYLKAIVVLLGTAKIIAFIRIKTIKEDSTTEA